MPSSHSIRRATLQDDVALAELVNFAGEGLPFYLWTKMAKNGEDAWLVGTARARREKVVLAIEMRQLSMKTAVSPHVS